MLLNEVCPQLKDPEPDSFAGLMEMYEWNYIRIRLLCENLGKLQSCWVSSVSDGMDLHMRLLMRNKYTTTILLTYYFSDDASSSEPRNFPDVQVRIYHDARQAEVLRISKQRKWQALESEEPSKPELSGRWASNRFLFKWLGYCLRQGHKFTVRNLKVKEV